jgi:K+-sensing histidine kinase KdpD
MGQVLWENYDKFDENQRRQATKEIAQSSERLNSLVNNIIDLSKLSSLKYTLDKKLVNLSELVYSRFNHCKKLYLNDKELEFLTIIEPNIKIDCDQHYITSTIDNLIINAIQYSGMTGKIIIKLTKLAKAIEFSIQDEGIGIPQNELRNIFGAFVVSSKTHTPAGGRGVGLALCEKVIKAHNGTIMAESNGKKGSTFIVMLPKDV